MIYLNKGIFKPMLILLSIIFLPVSITCLALLIVNFKIELFIVFMLTFLSYLAIVLGIYKYSKIEKNYLITKNNFILINYPSQHNCHEIDVRDIVKIEYYRISSIKAWCMLYNYVCPQCAYITYVCDGKEICKHIGYPDFNKISELCADINVELVIK